MNIMKAGLTNSHRIVAVSSAQAAAAASLGPLACRTQPPACVVDASRPLTLSLPPSLLPPRRLRVGVPDARGRVGAGRNRAREQLEAAGHSQRHRLPVRGEGASS